ncbi:uncharacterized protein KZ484_010411 isoform 2-T4 [Pholidichthys leucotaenia]
MEQISLDYAATSTSTPDTSTSINVGCEDSVPEVEEMDCEPSDLHCTEPSTDPDCLQMFPSFSIACQSAPDMRSRKVQANIRKKSSTVNASCQTPMQTSDASIQCDRLDAPPLQCLRPAGESRPPPSPESVMSSDTDDDGSEYALSSDESDDDIEEEHVTAKPDTQPEALLWKEPKYIVSQKSLLLPAAKEDAWS